MKEDMETVELKETDYDFDGCTGFYRGKVRDVYYFGKKMAVVVTDRISAFDRILPRTIPYKGQVLNLIASDFLKKTESILPNWLEASPHPNVAIGKRCEPFKVEMVIRGYLAGHAWREYERGKRTICGVELPNGLGKNDRLPNPIITPSTKAESGHDEDISPEEIMDSGLVDADDYRKLEDHTRRLFEVGSGYAQQRGLILVDTKYEFGKYEGDILLIDEVHTPDSSRYFYSSEYEGMQKNDGSRIRHLSKEFVREWLIEQGFHEHREMDSFFISDKMRGDISDRYLELYERMMGQKFRKPSSQHIKNEIFKAICDFFR